jgi:Mg-chelatase subunit ChlD
LTCTAGTWGSDTCTPGLPSAEICDNVDNDCNGVVDEALTQATSCGTGVCAAAGIMTCTAGTWGSDTCTPGAPSAEACNNIDDDCDGAIDEGVLNTFFADNDTDGYGNPNLSTEACSAQAGYVADNTDCDDSDAAVHPGASEIACDTIDQDCDGNDTGTYAWQVEPVFFDFGIIKQEKEFSVKNTGSCPIDISVNDSGIAEWAGVAPGAATLQSNDRIDIVAAVDRSGFVVGEDYSTAFTISSADVNDAVSIEITASAGDAKILFCVDTSGSMEWNDPDSQRIDAVKEVINMFYDNPHIEYAVVQFNSTAETLTDYTDDFTILMDSADALAPAAGWTTYLGDESYTPGALDEIDRLLDSLDTDTRYVVLFLSDGEPQKGVITHDAIVSKVEDIATPINVKMYTVFLYDGTQADSYQLLDDMAVAGGTYETHIYIDADSLSFVDLDF